MDWFTDSVKVVGKGFGGHHEMEWFHGIWEPEFLKECGPSIEFLERYAVAISVMLWTKYHKNTRIVLFCDNESVVYMVNKQSSKCRNCMTLIRLITLECLLQNVRLYARHVRTELNGRVDALSRDKISSFKSQCDMLNIQINPYLEKILQILQNIEDWWLHSDTTDEVDQSAEFDVQ